MSPLLALASALLWGCADFGGGFLSGRMRPVVASFTVGCFGLLGVGVFALAFWRGPFEETSAAFGVLAGVCAPVTIISYYKALVAGPMGVIASISTAGVVVPVVVGLISGESLSPEQVVGVGLVVVGIAVASLRDPSALLRMSVRTLGLAVVSALGFGAMLTFYAVGAQDSVVSTLLFQRVTYVALIGTLLGCSRRPVRVDRSGIRIAALAGVGAVGASGLYALATQLGAVSISAALACLSPVATFALARVVLSQRLTRLQGLGSLAAVAGAVVLAAQ